MPNNTLDLIGLAIDKNPVDFSSMVDDILRQKTLDALSAERISVAEKAYGTPSSEEGDDGELDGEVFVDDDFDDQIDLDDLDLEGISDDE